MDVSESVQDPVAKAFEDAFPKPTEVIPVEVPPAIVDVDMAVDTGVPPSELPPPESDAMQLGSLVTAFDLASIENIESRHSGFMQSVYQVKGQKPEYKTVMLRGQPVKLLFPGYAISDADGRYLDCGLAFQGVQTEIDSMSVQKQTSKVLLKQWGISPITTRWVCVDKDPTNVRMRLVAREIARGQLSAKDLMISSPTSSIESLRLMLAEASISDLHITGLDVSAAFMASPLGQKLGKPIKVILKLPPSIVFPNLSPVYLEAYKAINGLRSSGLAWVEHLANLLKSLQINPSRLESTIFAGHVSLKDKSKSWVQVAA